DHVDINPFEESSSHFETLNTAFDALQYRSQNFNSLLGGLGWELDYSGAIDDVKVSPYVQATYNHQFIANNTIEAGVSSLPGSHFELPVAPAYKDFGLISTGIRSTFNNGLDMTLGYNLMGARHYISQNFMVSFSVPI